MFLHLFAHFPCTQNFAIFRAALNSKRFVLRKKYDAFLNLQNLALQNDAQVFCSSRHSNIIISATHVAATWF